MKKKKYLLLMFIILLFVPYGAEAKVEDISHSRELKRLITVKEQRNQQGLATDGKNFYVSFDVGNGKGIIIKYNPKGKELKRTTKLKIGHAADLSFYKGYFYVANGGGKNPTKIFKVDFIKSKIVKTFDMARFGNSALLAMKDNGSFIVHTADNDNSKHHFIFLNHKGEYKRQFTVRNIGVPQGMEFYDGKIFFYTNNLITIMDERCRVQKKLHLNNHPGESEGITLYKGHIAVGYNKQNRILINN